MRGRYTREDSSASTAKLAYDSDLSRRKYYD